MTNLSGANLNNGAAVGPQGEGRESSSSFPVYPAYKDSGVEWLGDVPEGWSVASLRFFADLITGITPPSDDLSNYAEEGWSWVRPEDLDDSGKPVLASKFLTDQGWVFCRKVKGQSTLICCIGTIGKLGFIETDACTNQQITAVVPRQGGRFYFYAMHALKPAFDAYATGNVLRILNSERLGNVEVAVPCKSEADSIARFLDHETARIDALIEEQQRLIELLKEKRQAVISHAVTKGLDPTVPTKDSGVEWLGEVPCSWRVIKFGITHDKAELGGNYEAGESEEGLPLIKMGNIGRGKIKLDKVEYVSLTQDIDNGHTLKEGDFLFNTRNSLDLVGKVCVWRRELQAALYNSNILRISFNKSLIGSSGFVNYLLNSNLGLEQLRLIARGTTSVAAIYYKDLSSLSFAFPLPSEQLEIERFLDIQTSQLDALVNAAEQAIDLIKERRSALISAAVTGKIDVRGWQPPASAPSSELADEAV